MGYYIESGELYAGGAKSSYEYNGILPVVVKTQHVILRVMFATVTVYSTSCRI